LNWTVETLNETENREDATPRNRPGPVPRETDEGTGEV